MGYGGSFNDTNNDELGSTGSNHLLPSADPFSASNVILFPSVSMAFDTAMESDVDENATEASTEGPSAPVVSLFPFEQLQSLQLMINAPLLEAEKSMMQLRQQDRHQQLKSLARHDLHLFASLEKIELLNTLLSEQTDNKETPNAAIVEELQYKKNCLVAQSGLPVEYLQVESLTREILCLNQTLLGLSQTSPKRLKFICDHPAELALVSHRIEKLKRFKDILYKELEIQERSLQGQLFPPPLYRQMIDELRPIWKGLSINFKGWIAGLMPQKALSR